MAQGIYVGVNSAPKKVKEMYVGVDGTPRKVKEGYVGVGGVPKLFYSSLPPKDTLENTSWADIQTIAKAGRAADYWAVGDIKSIVFNSKNYCVQIIGFNHDDVEDPVAYGRDKAGITFQFGAANDLNNPGLYRTSDRYPMNMSNLNRGGWPEAPMRTSTMPEMKSYFQSEVQNIITNVKKVTSTGGNGNKTDVIVSIDDLWLPSVAELTGTNEYSVEGEGVQYQFYKDGGSLVRHVTQYEGIYGLAYWTRSPYTGTGVSYCYVESTGDISYETASKKYDITFCFCV